ncbi:MAG: hypothetical protein ACRD1Z_14780 [Vicinamibacteria bacterium]
MADLLASVGAEAIESAGIDVRYEGYIERQRRTVERAARNEHMELPDGLFEQPMAELSKEGREKIRRFMPRTVAQAGRIPGVSPADVAVLTIYAERERRLDVEQPAPGSGARLPQA